MRQKVLIFPAGSEIGMEIYHSLKYSHHVEVFGASGKSDHASFLYEASRYVEDAGLYIDAPDFIDRFNSCLGRLGISFVFPTHDTVCNFLAEHQSKISAKIITSNAKANKIARHKRLTYELFAGHDFCPKVYAPPFVDLSYPVYVKPDDSQGGKGNHLVADADVLAAHLQRDPSLLVCEYLPGEELSVDCFTDSLGRLLFIGPRTRERVQMGISFRSASTNPDVEIRRIAETINIALGLEGAWFFQVKRDVNGLWKLLELAPRQSSTMGLYRHAGVNFALLSLFNAMKVPVQILRNEYSLQLDRCLHNRYKAELEYSRVYIDFDETVAIGRKVHGRVMDYLYQCRNRGVEIILITKHREDLSTTLAECAISERLFDEIIHLRDEQDKADFIDPAGAIFIDNYWHDRRAVKARHGIPVFDVDAVDCLMK